MHEVLFYKAPKAGNAKHIRFANKKRAQVSSMRLFHYEARHTFLMLVRHKNALNSGNTVHFRA